MIDLSKLFSSTIDRPVPADTNPTAFSPSLCAFFACRDAGKVWLMRLKRDTSVGGLAQRGLNASLRLTGRGPVRRPIVVTRVWVVKIEGSE